MGVGDDATMLGYFPNKLTVKAGTTVTFVNKSPSEAHNVVFGPKKYIEQLQKKTDLLPHGPDRPEPGRRRSLLYGSEPKGGYTYDGDEPRQRLLRDAGDDRPGTPSRCRTRRRSRSRSPGKYKYFCWIHGPDMRGEIDVTP